MFKKMFAFIFRFNYFGRMSLFSGLGDVSRIETQTKTHPLICRCKNKNPVKSIHELLRSFFAIQESHGHTHIFVP